MKKILIAELEKMIKDGKEMTICHDGQIRELTPDEVEERKRLNEIPVKKPSPNLAIEISIKAIKAMTKAQLESLKALVEAEIKRRKD